MKKSSFALLALLLTACSTTHFHFLEDSLLSIDRNKSLITNSRTGVKYPLREDIFSPNYTGGYELNLVSGNGFNRQYEAYNMVSDCLKELPFRQKNVEFVYADKCIVLWIGHDYREWAPDYTFGVGEEKYVEDKNAWNKSVALGRNMCWRNLLVSKKKHRILCVDRVVIDGRPAAIVYIMQADVRGLSLPTLFHWDITRPELLPNTGYVLDSYADVTRDILMENNKK